MPVVRSNIDEISIQNFKFFPKLEKPIKVNGNHLLLYGENGSGKSSIYWALYTLLECANKDDDTQIKKYFNPGDDERLTNIHIKPGTPEWVDPFIRVTIKDGSNPYYVSFADTTINTNKEAQESNFSSDFINYRSLLSLYNFAHSEDIDLFPFFLYAVLPYVKFAPVTYWHEKKDNSIVQFTTESANGIWEFVKKGPQRNKANRKGNPRFPIRREQEFADYRNIVAGFKTGLEKLLTDINTEGNPILKDELGYNMIFKLELEEEKIFYDKQKTKPRKEPFLLTEQQFHPPVYHIWLKITEYEGEADSVKRAHSFLNEARLTAVGLALRLAVLKRTTSEDAKLKILALDDLLISLDMSNREKVLDLIFQKYQTNYQCLIFTHDKNFFDLIKKIIEQNKYPNWCFFEMYADDTVHKPLLLDSGTYYSKACYHLKTFDYPAAGNYFRKAAEEIFETLFPREVTISENGQKKENLKNYIDSGIKFYTRIGQSIANLNVFDNYVFLLLNPLSHRAIETNVYKVELTRVKDLLPLIAQEVRALNFRELIASENILVIHFVQDATIQHEYFIKTKEAIYLYNTGGIDTLSNSRCKSYESSTITNGGAPVIVANEHYDNNNIDDLHKAIYAFKQRPYDNSLMTNVYHQEKDTNQRTSLQQLVNNL